MAAALSLNQVVAEIARKHADNAENAGDFVGANDMVLANQCYALAHSLRAYAEVMENRNGG